MSPSGLRKDGSFAPAEKCIAYIQGDYSISCISCSTASPSLPLSPSLSLVLFVCFKRGEHWRLMKGIGKKEARRRKSCLFLLRAGKCVMEGACQSLRPKRNLCVDAGTGLNTASLMSIEVDYRRTAAMLKEFFVFWGVFMCFVPF